MARTDKYAGGKKTVMAKKKSGILVTIIVLAFLICICGFYVIGLSPAKPGDEEEITVSIASGTGSSEIVQKLDDAGLVRNLLCAKINTKLGGYDSLQANTYVFTKDMSFPQIMKAINTGDFDYISKRSITIKDGDRLEQVASAMSQELGVTQKEVMNRWSDKTYVKTLISKYWFLTDDILDNDVMFPLEGYLYADTYFVTTEDPSIEDFTEMCLDRMDEELTKRKADIEKSGFSVHEFLTLTSIVTKESRSDDQPKVAGVFINRLNKGISLGSDVTVAYIFQEDRVELKQSQLDSDSPYNTRKVTGLPPGPISQVFGDAMDAVLNYKKSDNLYFFADAKGKVHYFKTQDDFEKGIKEIGLLKDDDE